MRCPRRLYSSEVMGQVLKCRPRGPLPSPWWMGHTVVAVSLPCKLRTAELGRAAEALLALTAMPAPTLGVLLLLHDHEPPLYDKKMKTLREG